MGTYTELLAVQQPQTLHEQLVLFRHRELKGVVLGMICAAGEAVEVEQDVVEDGEFVVDAGDAVANLSVQFVEALFAAFRRISLG